MRYTNTNPNSSLLPHDIIVSGGGDFVVIAQRSGPQLGSVFLQVNGTGQYVSSRFYQGYTITSIDNYGQWMYSLTGTRDSMNYHFTALKTVDGSGAGCDDTTAVFGVGPVQYTSTTGGTVLNSTMSAVNGNLPVINTTIATHSDCNLTGVTGHAEMENNISVYPVPAKEQLFISSASEITMIEIIGVNGAVVHSQVVNSSLCVVQTENMADGAYLLRVTHGAGVTVLKTVIAH